MNKTPESATDRLGRLESGLMNDAEDGYSTGVAVTFGIRDKLV